MTSYEEKYLRPTEIIDWKDAEVLCLARNLAADRDNPAATARNCFHWVRDTIDHSGDCRHEQVTCCASEVLRHKTGWCFAKSHLLAALLRANSIPAGFCYQRLRRDDGTGFSLHGLNAVLLPDFGWYRMDSRGNKPGVNARFTPPVEQLAWPVTAPGEKDFTQVLPDPLPVVIQYLQSCSSLKEAVTNLPDSEVLTS